MHTPYKDHLVENVMRRNYVFQMTFCERPFWNIALILEIDYIYLLSKHECNDISDGVWIMHNLAQASLMLVFSNTIDTPVNMFALHSWKCVGLIYWFENILYKNLIFCIIDFWITLCSLFDKH